MADAKSELAEELEEAWKASEAEPQVDLTNLTFTLYECDHKEYEYKGEQREAYVAHVRVHGEEVERWFWIGGKSYPQVTLLLDKAVLPVVLKQIRDTERTGQPYKLILQDEAAQPRPDLVSVPGGQPTDSETPDASEMPAAIDVGALFNEAVLISDDDGAKLVGVLSDAGLDAIMDLGTDGKVFIKGEMAIGNRVKAVNLLNSHLEEAKKARAAS